MKVHLVKPMVFSSSYVWIWELDYKESWELKNWCFWTVVLEKTLESPLDCKEIQPVHSKMLKLKLQYFGHLIWRVDSLEKTLMLGGVRSRRRRGCQRWDGWMASLTHWTWVWVNSGSWFMDREAWHAAVHGVTDSHIWLSDWTKTIDIFIQSLIFSNFTYSFHSAPWIIII